MRRLALLAFLAAAAAGAADFRFVLLGDRMGEVQAGVFEKVWSQLAASGPAFVLDRRGAREHERSAPSYGEALRRLLRGGGSCPPIDPRPTGRRHLLRAAKRGRTFAAEREVRRRLVLRLDECGSEG